jgi:hypothetical protein
MVFLIAGRTPPQALPSSAPTQIASPAASALTAIPVAAREEKSEVETPRAVVAPRVAPRDAVPQAAAPDVVPRRQAAEVQAERTKLMSQPASVAATTSVAPTRQVRAARFVGSLVIGSLPPGARVFVNGDSVGLTPLVLTNLPVGSRAVRIEADDHTSWSTMVRVVADTQTKINATLSRPR